MSSDNLRVPCDYCGQVEAVKRSDWCSWKARGLSGEFHHACADRHQKAMDENRLHRSYCHDEWCEWYPLPAPVQSLNKSHGDYVVEAEDE